MNEREKTPEAIRYRYDNIASYRNIARWYSGVKLRGVKSKI